MEQLNAKLSSLSLDPEVFGPYLESMCEADDSGGEVELAERVQGVVEGAGGEGDLQSFAREYAAMWYRQKDEKVKQEEELLKKKQEMVERTLQEKKALRGEDFAAKKNTHDSEETPEERRRRQELIARYEGAPDIDLDPETGKVVVTRSGASEGGGSVGGFDANDNAERVKMAELAERNKQKAASAKQKELSKTSAFDGKKKKEEAKEKRRQKAAKVERKRM